MDPELFRGSVNMAIIRLSARQLIFVIFATASAAAIALVSAVAVLSGPTGQPPPRVLAQCTQEDTPGNASLDCAPEVVPDENGAPSEMGLTGENDMGVAPGMGGEGGGGGLGGHGGR
jgi:hypothetical protein